ncbi:hypothetical protein ETD96_41150 [Actinomadura geliboluensis]|uniref:Uncharacterized protein n=1 Tax=Actinomadura geliboluensis TaxID=882440 RepID=A0A5S4G253_9ACTN|nr:hypothetical protein ETD96_41150 [Actinomadura geliboluensis]
MRCGPHGCGGSRRAPPANLGPWGGRFQGRRGRAGRGAADRRPRRRIRRPGGGRRAGPGLCRAAAVRRRRGRPGPAAVSAPSR